jgi:energy-coupling factor transporter ATP-binding protein EcfA2
MEITAENQEMAVHFILIAGPSGSGKSTFIKALKERTMDPSILNLFPDQCWNWPLIEANDIFKGVTTPQKILNSIKPLNRAILHYDITYIHRFFLKNYTMDPMSELLAKAEHISLVQIEIDQKRLIHQHTTRAEQHTRSKTSGRRLWKKYIRQPIQKLNFFIQGKNVVDTTALYQSPEFVSACYATWNDFQNQFNFSTRMAFSPVTDNNGNPSFKMIINDNKSK